MDYDDHVVSQKYSGFFEVKFCYIIRIKLLYKQNISLTVLSFLSAAIVGLLLVLGGLKISRFQCASGKV